MTPEVRTSDPDGVDYGWVMQVTFITTLFAGTPVVAVLSVFSDLPTWPARALFAVRVGAAIWLLTLLTVYLYARRYREESESERQDERSSSDDPETTDQSTTGVDD